MPNPEGKEEEKRVRGREREEEEGSRELRESPTAKRNPSRNPREPQILPIIRGDPRIVKKN